MTVSEEKKVRIIMWQLTRVIECVHRVDKLFHCHCFVAQVLHVNLAFGLVNEEDAWCEHAHPANTINTFAFLEDAGAGELLVEGWDAILLGKAFLHDAALTK